MGAVKRFSGTRRKSILHAFTQRAMGVKISNPVDDFVLA